MGFGTELLFVVLLGFVVLGPKRLHTVLEHVARAKAEFVKASRDFRSQLAPQLEGAVDDKSDGAAVHLETEDETEPKQSN
jgi:Sec-independent protein translocase protein TatA